MFYRAVAATCPGKNKEYNSNNIYLNSKYITEEYKASEVLLRQKKEQEGLQFYAITEGFGAERYADEASLIAVKKLEALQKNVADNEISDDYDEAADILYSYMEDYVKSANEAVVAKATELPENDIHSSMAAMAIYEKSLITCNLGNTKIFLFRKGKLSKLSEEHNHAYLMYKNGLIEKDRLDSHPKKNKLTQYLGILPEDMQPEPYYSEAEIKHGDIFLMCSSTFCDCVSEEEICEAVRTSKSLTQIIEKMMGAAAEFGFENDTSILVVRADSHEKAAAPLAAGAVGAAAAGAGTKAKKTAAKGTGTSKAKETNNGESAFMVKVKNLLGLGENSENETIWPAIITFVCCIMVVIVLAFLGIKIYNASKDPGDVATKPPVSTATMSPEGNPSATPTDVPTAVPTMNNTETPTTEPTPMPTTEPTTEPTPTPTTEPTPTPTTEPTPTPTTEPTPTPTTEPTPTPTTEPTPTPTTEPTPTPTTEPTPTPTAESTPTPTAESTPTPTAEPTPTPTAESTEEVVA